MAFSFMFASNFPSLVQADFDSAYTVITTNYAGVSTLWDSLEATLKENKRILCYNYLVAWYLANKNPTAVRGIASDGGKPLASKSIGGTSLTFKDIQVQSGMEQFATNTFGLEALRMILSSPERLKVYG